MKFFICFSFSILLAISIGHTEEIGIAWEFNQDGDSEGWQIKSSLSNLRVSDGTLKATVTGTVAQLTGPAMALSARDYGILQIRMKVEAPQSAVIYWMGDSTAAGYESFPVTGDGLFHEYFVRLYQRDTWLGQIHQITRLTMLTRVGSEIEIDYIRILRMGVTGKVIDFKPLRTVLKRGEPIPWTAVIENGGDESGRIRSVLRLPDEFQLTNGSTETEHSILAPEETDSLNWTFRCDQAGRYNIRLAMMSEMDTTEFGYTAEIVDECWHQDEFLLSAWSPPYAWYPPPYDEQVFDDYQKANFDFILWVAPTDEAMAIVEKLDMKCLLIVSNLVGGDVYLRANNNLVPPRITDEMLANLDPVIEKYRNHPNVIGYFIIDEPKMPAFPNCGKVMAYLRKKDPTRLGYINVFPGDDARYHRYLESFMDTAKPELLSYDRYTFFNGYDGNEFFLNLAIIRKWALRYGVPFCNIIQAIGTNEYDLNWRTPNEAEHRWLVYNSLAYGAKALIWFHWHADWGVTGSEKYDQIYASLQKTNSEVKRLGRHLLNLHSEGAFHSGWIPRGGQPLPADIWIQSGSPDARLVIGLFKDEADRDFFMVTNANYRDSVTARILIKGCINDLRYFDIQGADWAVVNHENTPEGAAFDVPLRPGSGKLFAIEHTARVILAQHSANPVRFELMQNYPNPFNPVTRIRYVLPEPSQVALKIYNIRGEEVKTLVKEHQSAGHKEIIWNGEGNAGAMVNSGVYFYQLRAPGQILTRKLILIK